MGANIPRFDHLIIEGIIHNGAKVVDLGCGTGELISHLADTKDAVVQGIELNENAIYKCVEKGLSVLHNDLDNGLKGFPDKTFDYVILNQSLQEVKKVEYVIDESLRVGIKVIIGFPNFAHITARATLFFGGRAPMTAALPYQWHDTPNLRFLSIYDFKNFCRWKKIKITQSCFLGKNGIVNVFPNIFALNAIFVITK
ncbi:MAG: methionine biosynthesis protein MetW [Elusimicrobiota bacterium]